MGQQLDKSWIILYQLTHFIFVLLCYILSAMTLVGSKYAVSCLEEQPAVGWIKNVLHTSPMKHFKKIITATDHNFFSLHFKLLVQSLY
jgi:hypothetical protein